MLQKIKMDNMEKVASINHVEGFSTTIFDSLTPKICPSGQASNPPSSMWTYSWGKKDSTLFTAHGVKPPLLRAVWAGQGLILPLEK